jgi:hypothetical protein
MATAASHVPQALLAACWWTSLPVGGRLRPRKQATPTASTLPLRQYSASAAVPALLGGRGQIVDLREIRDVVGHSPAGLPPECIHDGPWPLSSRSCCHPNTHPNPHAGALPLAALEAVLPPCHPRRRAQAAMRRVDASCGRIVCPRVAQHQQRGRMTFAPWPPPVRRGFRQGPPSSRRRCQCCGASSSAACCPGSEPSPGTRCTLPPSPANTLSPAKPACCARLWLPARTERSFWRCPPACRYLHLLPRSKDHVAGQRHTRSEPPAPSRHGRQDRFVLRAVPLACARHLFPASAYAFWGDPACMLP